jgi:hypothetical protein
MWIRTTPVIPLPALRYCHEYICIYSSFLLSSLGGSLFKSTSPFTHPLQSSTIITTFITAIINVIAVSHLNHCHVYDHLSAGQAFHCLIEAGCTVVSWKAFPVTSIDASSPSFILIPNHIRWRDFTDFCFRRLHLQAVRTILPLPSHYSLIVA